jgi:hypothetical protein
VAFSFLKLSFDSFLPQEALDIDVRGAAHEDAADDNDE